jgi:hypothetical protein
MLRLPTFGAVFALLVVALWGAERYLETAAPLRPLADAVWFMTLTLALVLLVATSLEEPEELHRIPLVLWVGFTLVLGTALAYWVYNPVNPTATVATAAAVLGTIGWLVQRDSSMYLNRKQHTLNILLQTRQSEAFNKHRTNTLARYPHKVTIPATDIPELMRAREIATSYGLGEGKETKFPVIESIIFMANFYEFLAASIRAKDLDENLLYDTLGDIAVSYYEKVQPVIAHHQQPDGDGTPTTDIFTQYRWLYLRWKKRAADEEARRR